MADRQPRLPLSPELRSQRGVVLLVVLFFALLLSSSIATFLRRSTVDYMIARNRENTAEAEALARGGVRLAEVVLMEDRIYESARAQPPMDTSQDIWAQLSDQPFAAGGGTLKVRIEDSGSRLNLNALFKQDDAGMRVPYDETEVYLHALFEKVIDDMPIPPGEKIWDVRELTDNLIDWIDSDQERRRGGPEDDYYQRQDPPYYAANQPLFSLDDLRLVEGFDNRLVDALRAYVTVYPYAAGGCGTPTTGCGVNLNTAPPHVLALLFYDDGVDMRLATEDLVREILRIRQDEGMVCAEGQSEEGCTPIGELVTNAIFPPPTISSEVFLVTAEARVGEVRRVIEAAVDRSAPGEPRLLSWRVR